MSNFTDFFPAAGGGGGFSKMNKYSTLRSADADFKSAIATSVNVSGDTFPPSTTLSGRPTSNQSLFAFEDSLVGCKFTNGGTEHTVTASANHTAGSYFTITFTPALTSSIANNVNLSFSAASITVNPANDLGLSDGDSIGYFMVGAGGGSTSAAGYGGNIIQGTKIISSASTDLVLIPATAATSGTSKVDSTISGGITLTTADGYGAAGAREAANGTYGVTSYGQGINGYGFGGKIPVYISGNSYPRGDQADGYGG